MKILDPKESLLFGPEDIARMGIYGGGLFPVDECMPILRDRQGENPPDGVLSAVRLLLQESAVSIAYVNTEEVHTEEIGTDRFDFLKASELLGFNDHGGGSESDYKILLQDVSQKEQYVLYSPPLTKGLSANLSFRAADFTYLSEIPYGAGYADVPNPMKTAGQARRFGRSSYTFMLFGTAETPDNFIDTFHRIGFTFHAEPYAEEELATLRVIASNMPSSVDAWPGGQFEWQLSQLC